MNKLFATFLIFNLFLMNISPILAGFFSRNFGQQITTNNPDKIETTTENNQSLTPDNKEISLITESSFNDNLTKFVSPNNELMRSDIELRVLSLGSTVPLLLLPLLVTPFVPVAIAPFLITISASSLYFYKYGNFKNIEKIFDFASSTLKSETTEIKKNQKLNNQIEYNEDLESINELFRRLKFLFTFKGFNQFRSLALTYFGAEEPICQQRMVCEAAFSMTSKIPNGFSKIIKSLSTFIFGKKPNRNSFFDSWLDGLSNEKCEIKYFNCSKSPFARLLDI